MKSRALTRIHSPDLYTNNVCFCILASHMEPLPVIWKTHVSFPSVPEITDALAWQHLIIQHLDLLELLGVSGCDGCYAANEEV